MYKTRVLPRRIAITVDRQRPPRRPPPRCCPACHSASASRPSGRAPPTRRRRPPGGAWAGPPPALRPRLPARRPRGRYPSGRCRAAACAASGPACGLCCRQGRGLGLQASGAPSTACRSAAEAPGAGCCSAARSEAPGALRSGPTPRTTGLGLPCALSDPGRPGTGSGPIRSGPIRARHAAVGEAVSWGGRLSSARARTAEGCVQRPPVCAGRIAGRISGRLWTLDASLVFQSAL